MPFGNPNVADPEVMWDWLRAYGVPFYDTFWWVNGIEEYKKIYGRSYAEELRIRLEDGVSWLHVDTMDLCNGKKVTLFKA